MHEDAAGKPLSDESNRPAVASRPHPVERRVTSRELFAGAREVVIEHDGRTYRMRITQNGKLILTA
jgi:hemin uptake protein HemP